MINIEHTAGKTALPMVCSNMNIAIGTGIAMPAGVDSSNVFLNLGFLSNRLDINIKNKILKQNERMPGLPFMYVFNQATTTGYTGAKNGYYFTSANFEDNIWPSHKFKPQKNYRGENGEPPLVAAPQNRHRFRKIKP